MAGMAKRGSHSPRHRAGRARPGALAAAIADVGLNVASDAPADLSGGAVTEYASASPQELR